MDRVKMQSKIERERKGVMTQNHAGDRRFYGPGKMCIIV